MLACDKIEINKKHPSLRGYENIEAHSNGPLKWRPLSPFNLGPFTITEKYNPDDVFIDGVDQYGQKNQYGWTKIHNGKEWMQTITCLSFERYWQGGKVFKVDLDDIAYHPSKITPLVPVVDYGGFNPNSIPNPNTAPAVKDDDGSIKTPVMFDGKILNGIFYRRRVDVLQNPNREKKDIRHPLPKARYGLPIQGYYSNEFVDYVTSRKKYYCPGYEYFAWSKEEYKILLNKYFNGDNLLILGPDGLNVPINEASMKQVINDSKYIFGHELVLCCMLAGLKPWLS